MEARSGPATAGEVVVYPAVKLPPDSVRQAIERLLRLDPRLALTFVRTLRLPAIVVEYVETVVETHAMRVAVRLAGDGFGGEHVRAAAGRLVARLEAQRVVLRDLGWYHPDAGGT